MSFTTSGLITLTSIIKKVNKERKIIGEYYSRLQMEKRFKIRKANMSVGTYARFVSGIHL